MSKFFNYFIMSFSVFLLFFLMGNMLDNKNEDLLLGDTYYLGDVDCNGTVGASDYLAVKKHILSTSILTGEKLNRADVDGDGSVSSKDYIKIKKIIINGELTEVIIPTVPPAPIVTPVPVTPVPVTPVPVTPPPSGGSSIIDQIDKSGANPKFEGPTLKYYVLNKSGYYLTYIWMADPYSQIGKLESTTAEYGSVLTDDELAASGRNPVILTVEYMLERYASLGIIPRSKAAIAFNASAYFKSGSFNPPTEYYNKRSDAWLVFNNGKLTRKILDDSDKWTNNHRILIGITSGGNLGIYGAGYTQAEREQIYNSVVRDGVANTFTFRGPVLVGPQSWKTGKADTAHRQAICQYDSNTYIMLTATGNYTTDAVANILTDLGCQVAFNLDGGGSTSIIYKDPNSTSVHKKVCLNTASGGCRAIAEGIYFTE